VRGPAADGQRLHRVRFQDPGEAIPDGMGGFTEGWADLAPPEMFARIVPASPTDIERVGAGTVTASATHLLTAPFHKDVTTKTRVLWTDFIGRAHEFSVANVVNLDERCTTMVLVCEEKVE
jgi:head-tail adaptor